MCLCVCGVQVVILANGALFDKAWAGFEPLSAGLRDDNNNSFATCSPSSRATNRRGSGAANFDDSPPLDHSLLLLRASTIRDAQRDIEQQQQQHGEDDYEPDQPLANNSERSEDNQHTQSDSTVALSVATGAAEKSASSPLTLPQSGSTDSYSSEHHASFMQQSPQQHHHHHHHQHHQDASSPSSFPTEDKMTHGDGSGSGGISSGSKFAASSPGSPSGGGGGSSRRETRRVIFVYHFVSCRELGPPNLSALRTLHTPHTYYVCFQVFEETVRECISR